MRFIKNNKRVIIFILIVIVIEALVIGYGKSVDKNYIDESLSGFLGDLKEGKVDDIVVNKEYGEITYKKGGNKYKARYVHSDKIMEDLLNSGAKVSVSNANVEVRDNLRVITGIMNVCITFYLIYWVTSRVSLVKGDEDDCGEGVESSSDLGDVAGYEEIKEEISYIIDFLKNPEKYKKMGADFPRGIVLSGPPGTGKTLLARAIAGEAEVPFLYANGSDFIEMFAGVGARRVRKLFKKAKKYTRCIVFIDEIDAIGGKRNQRMHSENHQTLNALLNELDGFSENDAVITMCATNRYEMLDDALIRAGRFDKHIFIRNPNKEERFKILEKYISETKVSDDVDINSLASLTSGFSGADLKNLVNQSIIEAVKRDSNVIENIDIDNAYFKIGTKGSKKRRGGYDSNQKKLVAWHEAGHTLVARLLEKKVVDKMTIIPSTSGVGGFTVYADQKEVLINKKDIENKIKTLYAGNIAEEILLGNRDEITIGAYSDIQKATQLIKDYITKYGMDSEMGLINLEVLGVMGEGELIGRANELSKRLYNETKEFMMENEGKLKELADIVLEKETIYKKDIDNILIK